MAEQQGTAAKPSGMLQKMQSLSTLGAGNSMKKRALSLGDSKAPQSRSRSGPSEAATNQVPLNDFKELVEVLDIGIEPSVLAEVSATGRILIKQGDVRSVIFSRNVSPSVLDTKAPLFGAMPVLDASVDLPQTPVELKKHTGIRLFFFNDILIVCKSPTVLSSSILGGSHKPRYPTLCEPIYCKAMLLQEPPASMKDHEKKICITFGDNTALFKFDSVASKNDWVDSVQGAIDWLASISNWSLLTPTRRAATVRLSRINLPKRVSVEDALESHEEGPQDGEDPLDYFARKAALEIEAQGNWSSADGRRPNWHADGKSTATASPTPVQAAANERARDSPRAAQSSLPVVILTHGAADDLVRSDAVSPPASVVGRDEGGIVVPAVTKTEVAIPEVTPRLSLSLPPQLKKANSDSSLTSPSFKRAFVYDTPQRVESAAPNDATSTTDVASGITNAGVSASVTGAPHADGGAAASAAPASSGSTSLTPAAAERSMSIAGGTLRGATMSMMRSQSNIDKGGLATATASTISAGTAAAALADAGSGAVQVMYLSEGGVDKMILRVQVNDDDKSKGPLLQSHDPKAPKGNQQRPNDPKASKGQQQQSSEPKAPKIEVIAGTPEKLAERLADESQRDINYVWAFLLSYRTFMTPVALFKMMSTRFNMTMVNNANENDKTYFEKWRRPIMTLVINTVVHWITWHYQDFADNPDLDAMLSTFLANVSEQNFRIAREMLDELRAMHRAKSVAVKDLLVGPPPKSFKKRLDSIVPKTKAPELAEQITLFDAEIFAKVTPIEYMNTIWPPKGKEKEEHSPMLMQFIQRFDTESYWVATEVCSFGDPQMQSLMIRKFIKVAVRCLELNNFYSMFAVMGGLSFPPIRRMKAAWEMLSEKTLRAKERVEKIMNPSRNMRSYRDAIAAVPKGTAAIPFLPVYMKDLVFINDGNPKLIEGMINFEKLTMLANVVQRLVEFRSSPYPIVRVTHVMSYLEGTKIIRDVDKLTSDVNALTEKWKADASQGKGSVRRMME
eukprot:Opistho-2@17179